MLLYLLLLPLLAGQPTEPDAVRFLERIEILSVDESEGNVSFRLPDGTKRTLSEGERLEEEDGALLSKVTARTLTFRREDERYGKSLIVVRFRASGATKVREYFERGEVPPVKVPDPRPGREP